MADIVESLLEHGQKPRAKRRMLFKNRIPRPPADPFEMPLTADTTTSSDGSNPDSQPVSASTNGPLANGTSSHANGTSTPPRTDILLHSLLAPSLSLIDISTILQPNTTSLVLLPPTIPHAAPTGKNARRGANANHAKHAAAAAAAAAAGNDDLIPAPGTATALAIASGQQAPRRTNNAGASTGMVLGKSLSDLKKMELASQLEMDADWARIQQGGTRGRRGRGD